VAILSCATAVDLEWKSISTAPFGRDLELAFFNKDAIQTLVFPCRRVVGGWLDAETNEWLDVSPTHWREWKQSLFFFLFGASN
jgi:hypothetical protein